MFTIKALTKATVYEISRVDLAPILEKRPAIAAELGEILAHRQAIGKARLEEFTERSNPDESLATRFGQRVKDLFGLARRGEADGRAGDDEQQSRLRAARLRSGFLSKRVGLSSEPKAVQDVGSARKRSQMCREVLSHDSGYDLHEGVVEIAHLPA